MNDGSEMQDDDARYLLFKVGGDLYGTPLLGIREVVEPQEAKPLPNTAPFFSGVINLRGQVVGVVDLRKRFGCEAKKHAGMALMVFDTETGPLAALVDEIECVVQIPPSQIESKPPVRSHVSVDYLLGIGNHESRLVSLIDLNRVLGSEELKSASSVRV
jgi:purine-binding chemotaxis protein CheW